MDKIACDGFEFRISYFLVEKAAQRKRDQAMFDSFVDKVENEPEDQQKDFEGLISKKLLFKI